MKAALLTLALVAIPAAAMAAATPQPGAVDARIQSVQYDPDQVILLRGALGNQLMLQFGPGERLENVAVGDSLGWQVTPNKRADLLFVKPIDPKSATNMTVVTNLRNYVFELRVAPAGSASATPYMVRFRYPPVVVAVAEAPPPPTPPREANISYAMVGAQELRPARVFDDGKRAYFTWPKDFAVPAIFAVAADGSESVVNYVVRDGFIVVDQLSPRFRLRKGQRSAEIIDKSGAAVQTARTSR